MMFVYIFTVYHTERVGRVKESFSFQQLSSANSSSVGNRKENVIVVQVLKEIIVNLTHRY